MSIDAAIEPIPRDRYGRPLIVPVGGGKAKAYMRATTLAGTLDDRFNLERWKMRQVALGLSIRPDLAAMVASHRDDKESLNATCEQAMEAAAASGRANLGTALHAFTQAVDLGQDLGVIPAEIARDVDAYRSATARLEPVLVERLLVLDDWEVAGTPDRVYRLPDGSHVIGDLKTGDSVELAQGAIAIQLAIYARGLLYDRVSGLRTALPDVDTDRALVVHMPAGGGKVALQWVDIRQGWEAATTARWVRDYRKAKLLSSAADLANGTEPPAMAGLVERIGLAGTVADLEALWYAHQAEWTPRHTDLAAARKRDLAAA